MSHYRVILGTKDKDYDSILENNIELDGDGYMCGIYGFDYMTYLNQYTVEEFAKTDISYSEIIDNNVELWWTDYISNAPPKMAKEEALKRVIENNKYITLFDVHL